MLTLFTIPKPFRGHMDVIQRNAIQSWTLLRPRCDILLFGDDLGVGAAAAEFGVRHVADIARNEYGTPLINDVFAQAERLAANSTLCYINADIIVMHDLIEAIARIRRSRYLLLGQRWDLDLMVPWDFSQPAWDAKLRADVQLRGKLHSYMGVDYYVFPRELWGTLPPFAVGRTTYDNWLIWRARALGVPVIDATRVVTCIHQNHERTYSVLDRQSPDGGDDVTKGVEARRNLDLAGGRQHVFTLRNANWVLTRRALFPALKPRYLLARLTSRLRLMLSTLTRRTEAR